MFEMQIINRRFVSLGLIVLHVYLFSTQIIHADDTSDTSTSLPPVNQPSVSLSSVEESLTKKSPWFYGGGLSAQFGDVQYFEVSPLMGYNVNPKTAVGISLLYRYRTDDRFRESYSTTDYGATLFGRFNITPLFYLQAEYEYIDYEFAVLNAIGNVVRKDRDNFSSILAGAGIQKPLSSNAALYFTAMYNFNYDDVDSPYTDPVSIRFGIGVGF